MHTSPFKIVPLTDTYAYLHCCWSFPLTGTYACLRCCWSLLSRFGFLFSSPPPPPLQAAKEGEGPRQEVWRNTVKVERCRYLEASKCKGTCMNLCKLPTEAFFREDLGEWSRSQPARTCGVCASIVPYRACCVRQEW